MAGEGMTPPSADLIDEEWKHGATDGELFVVIRDGTRQGMKSFKRKLAPREIWHVVNYLRTFRETPAKSH